MRLRPADLKKLSERAAGDHLFYGNLGHASREEDLLLAGLLEDISQNLKRVMERLDETHPELHRRPT